MKLSDKIKSCHILVKGWAVCIEEDDGSGSRIGPCTQDPYKAAYAAAVVKDLVQTLEREYSPTHLANARVQRYFNELLKGGKIE